MYAIHNCVPVTQAGLAEQSGTGIPGRAVLAQAPAPVSAVPVEWYPHRSTQGASKMCHSGIH